MRKTASGAEACNLKPYIYEEQMSFIPLTPVTDRTEGNLQMKKKIQVASSVKAVASYTTSEHHNSDEEDKDETDSDCELPSFYSTDLSILRVFWIQNS